MECPPRRLATIVTDDLRNAFVALPQHLRAAALRIVEELDFSYDMRFLHPQEIARTICSPVYRPVLELEAQFQRADRPTGRGAGEEPPTPHSSSDRTGPSPAQGLVCRSCD